MLCSKIQQLYSVIMQLNPIQTPISYCFLYSPCLRLNCWTHLFFFLNIVTKALCSFHIVYIFCQHNAPWYECLINIRLFQLLMFPQVFFSGVSLMYIRLPEWHSRLRTYYTKHQVINIYILISTRLYGIWEEEEILFWLITNISWS
jgi:hypothetical protein